MNPGIETLTDEQYRIVYSNCKINAALCCPGSGKTAVLTERAKRLWEDFKEPILICTFSTKAVKDITKRLDPDCQNFIKTQTIHSLCYSIVRDYWHVLGDVVGGQSWPLQPKLVDKQEELGLIQEAHPGKDYVKLYNKFDELRKLTITSSNALRLFKKGLYFGKVSQQDLELWDKYEKYRLGSGAITFDDMVLLASMIMPIPEVSVGVCKLYRHVLIDEAQDTSESQWTVLRPIVAHAETTLIVGDSNQAIYGWRGADGSILSNLGFLRDAVSFRMTESFRNGSSVATFANSIVRDKSSQIVTKNGPSSVKITKFGSRQEEVSYVLGNVCKDSAIISRTNSYLEPFERQCILNNIPYSGTGFYRSPHIKTMWKFLSTLDNVNALDIIEKAFVENVTYTKQEQEDFKMALNIIKKEGLETFLTLVEKSATVNDDGGVILTTGHAAKGLQWPRIFVVGAHEGQIPHRLSTDDDEERNLFYVMCTREAGKGLEITYINEPSKYLDGLI